MLVGLWNFDTVLVHPFPISRLDFGYNIDVLLERIRKPPKRSVALIYHLPWCTKKPGWDKIILDPSKISMIVDDSCQPTLLIVPILMSSFYTYALRGHPRKNLLDSRPCQLICDQIYH